MIDDMYDGDTVILDLEPATALLLSRVLEAGLHQLRADMSTAETEQLTGLGMFLRDAAGSVTPERQGMVKRLVA
jgi:hypothetical protein